MKLSFLSILIIVFLALILSPADQVIDVFEFLEPAGSSLSCATPNVLNTRRCEQIEEQIYKSTVRILIESWRVKPDESGYIVDDAVGHATIIGGRYLITHNHFPIPLSIRPREGDPEVYNVVYLFDVRGRALLKAPLTDFELILEEEEVLVLAHRDAGFFTKLGLESAVSRDWQSLSLEAGVEVAQIDWDGQTTRVDWTTIREVKLDERAPSLVLDDGAIPGASGGGIFWGGYHIGNNWRVEERLDASGEVIDSVTAVALNTVQVAH